MTLNRARLWHDFHPEDARAPSLLLELPSRLAQALEVLERDKRIRTLRAKRVKLPRSDEHERPHAERGAAPGERADVVLLRHVVREKVHLRTRRDRAIGVGVIGIIDSRARRGRHRARGARGRERGRAVRCGEAARASLRVARLCATGDARRATRRGRARMARRMPDEHARARCARARSARNPVGCGETNRRVDRVIDERRARRCREAERAWTLERAKLQREIERGRANERRARAELETVKSLRRAEREETRATRVALMEMNRDAKGEEVSRVRESLKYESALRIERAQREAVEAERDELVELLGFTRRKLAEAEVKMCDLAKIESDIKCIVDAIAGERERSNDRISRAMGVANGLLDRVSEIYDERRERTCEALDKVSRLV